MAKGDQKRCSNRNYDWWQGDLRRSKRKVKADLKGLPMKFQKDILCSLFALLLCVGLPRCMTIVTISDHSDNDLIYSGTRTNLDFMHGSDHPHGPGNIIIVIGILDFPFSLVLDTLILPYTIPVSLSSSEPQTESQ